MSNYIAAATRSKCVDCGHIKFKSIKTKYFKNNIPVCENCEGEPASYRIIFRLPDISTGKFREYFKTYNNLGEKLDSAEKANAFLEFIKTKIKESGADFDPREFGTQKEREQFLVSNVVIPYEKHLRIRLSSNNLTPGGLAKKLGVTKNQIIPIFGELSIKAITYQVIERKLSESKLTDSMRIELIKELKQFMKFAAMQGLISGLPEFPKPPRAKTFKVEDFYTIQEQKLVINNIDDQRLKIAIYILATYTRRKSEVECLRWKDIDLKKGEIVFRRHMSDGKGQAPREERKGLKSSPDTELCYNFTHGLKEMLISLNPSFRKDDLVFPGARGGFMAKNTLWSAWTNSVNDLVKKKKLNKRVDLHRGTRNSTLSSLYEAGKSEEILAELYGGDVRTMKKHYAKKRKQSLVGIYE